ncbi:MAG: glycosyltransferase family 4 protein [Gammaproteobacteria bacterium]
MAKKKSICFVGADNYPVLTSMESEQQFGGESVQQTLLARCFVELGYDVSMIVRDHGQKDVEQVDGITVIKGFLDQGGIPVVRWLHPRMTGLYAALKKADADYYFSSCAGVTTGVVGRYCKNFSRCHLFRLAHDSDVMPGKQLIRFWRDRKIYEYGLKNADIISAQGVVQQKLLKENYGLDSTPVNMMVEFPEEGSNPEKDIDVLWVNNLRHFKRPERAVNVARLLPEYTVHMIGGPVNNYEDLFAEVKKEAEGVDNLTFNGSIPYSLVNGYFERSRVFINTSDQEGFPNSFLQAWIRKVPTVSFFDPDGLIAKHDLGGIPQDDQSMADRVRSLLTDQNMRNEAGERGATIARDNYFPMAIARKYEELLQAYDEKS